MLKLPAKAEHVENSVMDKWYNLAAGITMDGVPIVKSNFGDLGLLDGNRIVFPPAHGIRYVCSPSISCSLLIPFCTVHNMYCGKTCSVQRTGNYFAYNAL